MTSLTTTASLVCFHCGEDCHNETVLENDKAFCCRGCQTVYNLLHDSGLESYYQLEIAPGSTQRTTDTVTKWAFLDQPDVIGSLVDFREGAVSRATFFVPSIHCSACIWLLEHLGQLHPGVAQAQVHFPKKQVSVMFRHDELPLRALVELLASVGYSPEISLGDTQPQPAARRDDLAIKIGVAGFCFGNVMLLSLPEYLDADFSLSPVYQRFFSYLTFLLALPVFFYSASNYFAAAYRGLRRRLLTIEVPIVLGLLTLFGRSSYEIFTHTGTGYMDSLTGLVFFLLIGQWYQGKTYRALSYDRDYTAYFPVAVTRLAEGQEISTLLKDLQVGNQLLIRNQELIPADAILLRGEARIDYSFVTGESEPVHKVSGDYLYAGGRQQGEPLVVELCKPVAQSYLTELWNQDVFRKEAASPLRPLSDQVSRYFTVVILLISLATAAYWYVYDTSVVLNAVTSVLIVACPCALALSVPFTFGHAVRLLGKHGLYLKNTEALEKLAAVDQIVFDKTGTITQSSGERAPSKIPFVGKPLTAEEQRWIRAVTRTSTHPLSQMIYRCLPADHSLPSVAQLTEQAGQGLAAEVAGVAVRLGSAAWVGAPPEGAALEGAAPPIVATTGEDTPTTNVYVRIGEQVRGYYQLTNHYRPGVEALMRALRPHYGTHLLSGDQDRERPALAPYFEQLHFRQSPMDKLRYLKQLEEAGHRPLMVGDGLNDAGALKQSYVGVAVADNVYHFSPACDAILDAKQLRSLDRFLRFARQSLTIVKVAFALSFLYNVVGLAFAVSGLLTPLIAAILMPLSSVTVVGFITLVVNARGRRLVSERTTAPL